MTDTPCRFIRWVSPQRLFCTFALILCRKCLASLPRSHLLTLLFFSSISPPPKTLKLDTSMPANNSHHGSKSEKLGTTPVRNVFKTRRRVHARTSLLDQRLLLAADPEKQLRRNIEELSISRPAFLGVGWEQDCWPVVVLDALFLASSRPSTTTAVPFLLPFTEQHQE